MDYDRYLEQLRVGVSETGSLRSLVVLSRKIKAVNAALLIKTGDAYVSRLRIGLMEKPKRILFSAGEPFYDRFLSRRQAVLLLDRLQIIPSLAARFNPEDLKYMQVAIFLPAIYQKAPAVLFLALPARTHGVEGRHSGAGYLHLTRGARRLYHSAIRSCNNPPTSIS